MVGRIIDVIGKYVGLERSVVVFTSDHGEAFGEHGMTEHGHTLHWEVLQVPLIITAPSLPAGRVVDRTVSTIDLLPTILALSGLASSIPDGLSGTDLFAADGRQPGRPLYAEAMLYGSTERSLIRGDLKVLYDEQTDSCSLFDVASDPMELVDIADRRSQTATAMCAELSDKHRTLLEDYRMRNAAKADAKATPEDALERQRALEALKSLGYVDE